MAGLTTTTQGFDLLSELEKAGALTSVGLRLTDPDLTYDTYAAIGLLLSEIRKSVQWAIGDYIILGEQLFKEQAYQAISDLDVSENGLREYVRVAERVPRSVRRPELSWSHHRAVAALSRTDPTGRSVPDIQAQKIWLAKASDERLSHHALRDALRNGAESARPTVCRCCGRELDA